MTDYYYTCIVCPVSCHMTVQEASDGELTVHGNHCSRGQKHALTEHTHPQRMLTTTIKLSHGLVSRLPVISTGEIPKDKLPECLETLYHIERSAPVKAGECLIENICDTGIHIIAARTIHRTSP